MKERQLNVFLCDDLWVSISGKMNAIGMYSGEVSIPTDPYQPTQLVFFYLLSGDLTDKPTSITFEVTLPGEKPNQMQVPAPPANMQAPEGRTKWIVRLPLIISYPVLRPGRVIAKAIFNDGELLAAMPWIIKSQQVASDTHKK